MQIDKACSSSGGTDKAPTMEASTLHNNAAILFPIFEQWRKQYGKYTALMYLLLFLL